MSETPKPSPVAKVATVVPERATVRRIAEQPGQIESVELTPIHAKLAGYVQTVLVDIGDRVKAGQVLAELRIPEIEAELRQKRAMIGQAEAERKQDAAAVEVAQAEVESAEAKVVEIRAGIRRTEAEIERWSAEFARVQQLAQERALVGSLVDETRSKLGAAQAARDEVNAQVRSGEAAVVRAKAMLDKARADVLAADSHVEVARFDAEQAEAMASYTKIQAPFDGVVVRRKVDRGQLTTPGTSGEPLFLVARHDVATISVGVPEADAPFVNPGDPARVRLLALGDKTFEGTVTRTAWALDSATRTLLVEIDLPNPEEVLRPGLYAYATIIADEHAGVLTLPASAVFKDGGKSFCVVVKDGRATRREIQVGLTEGKRTEIASGIGPDSQVVEANSASLTDGQPVETAKR
ncbi:efflux RND transporter periplasmic adaptor subunit [Paludisphaera rhizosphaerae]|uniref:efflux RND transporter periplasmic adaptor subunit n=1 Tax=Paludisphaera rhizosphaerae TaxID=2711216 RepID=UPI0013EB0F29|nr:efflux RND transporter periplasmic adaptor subunit [Paludisphaera rhizosphaerae]